MPSYVYKAINERNRTMRGTMSAENELDLELRLREVGLDLVDVKEEKVRKAKASGGVKLKDMLVFCLHLEQLSRAGVPIHESLADVRDSTDSARLRDTLSNVIEKVKSGSRLSEAMSLFPRVFNNVFVGLVQAGEKNGQLSESFTHMSEDLKWNNDLRRKVRKAIAYPAVVLVIMALVITVLMLFVVPKMVKFIVDQGFEIPIHTRALIATSYAFEHYWYLILGVPVFSIFGFMILYRSSEAFAYIADGILLRLPALGPVVQKINLARFVHFFVVMFRSGIDIPDALIASKNVIGNRVMREAIDIVHRSITEGNNLTNSLRVSNQFPNLVVRMFKIGEESGNMSEALENVSFFYSREVNDAVDKLVGMIQPALTIFMGALIAWVITAVFGPIYESFKNLKT
jgi:type IV pilus assembly protein PilC